MSWFTQTLSASIGRKLVMSLTGLFLVVFLLEHLIGNLLLLKDDEGLAFNEYAHFMRHNIFIMMAEVVLFGGFLFHIVDGIILMRKNQRSRPVGYTSNSSRVNTWVSRFMGPFGIVILVFLIIHLNNFFRYKYFPGETLGNMPGRDVADMAGLAFEVFKNPVEVGIYIVSMLVVAFHLWHGFQSAFLTLGLYNRKYTPLIRWIGKAFSIVVPLGLALIPIILYLRS